jgi:hypothetical protein
MNERLACALWRKSSYSSANGSCVEIAVNLPGIVAVRDSKNPDGPALIFQPGDWSAFVAGIRTGELDA